MRSRLIAPRTVRRWLRVVVASLIGSAAGAACAPAIKTPYVWVDEWKAPDEPSSDGRYVIGVGDALSVQVWEQEKMSAKVRVRSDGRVSLPFLNDVAVVGMTPEKLALDLADRLRKFIVSPQVTVVVDEAKPLSVSVLGQVRQPGLYTLEPGAGIAQALAVAGGLTDFAHRDRIFLVRSGNTPARIRMTFEAITANSGPAFSLRLRSSDVVVVE
jgi:polysaccharide biosynthesis/export protein